MKEQLATIRSEALAAFAQAGSSAELDALRVTVSYTHLTLPTKQGV